MDGVSPGQILHFYSHRAKKEKYHLVVCVDPKLILFLINTQIPIFERGKPHLKAHNALVLRADNPYCLRHDSYVHCGECFSEEDIVGTPEYYGQISEYSIPSVLEATEASVTLTPQQKAFVSNSF